MKIPKAFIPKKKKYSKDIEKILKTYGQEFVINDYERINFAGDNSAYILDYVSLKGKWILAEKEYYDVKWYDCPTLNEKAKDILAEILEPTLKLFNLPAEEYLEKYNNKRILDKFATRISKKINNDIFYKTELGRLIRLKELKEKYMYNT